MIVRKRRSRPLGALNCLAANGEPIHPHFQLLGMREIPLIPHGEGDWNLVVMFVCVWRPPTPDPQKQTLANVPTREDTNGRDD